MASSREVDLVQLSKKNPGCLLRSALKEMNISLLEARRIARIRLKAGWCRICIRSYCLSTQREVVTLATALDHLLRGELGECGDHLAQRFKAIEASLAADGSWAVARHQELIPAQALLSTRAELTEAAKAEIRAQKLKAQIHKTSK